MRYSFPENMRGKDTFDVHLSLLAVTADGAAVILGFLLATWLRFDSGWFPVVLGRPDQLYLMYGRGAAIAALLFLFVFKSLDLYVRPQVGSFGDKIPRLIRATGIGIFLTTIPAFLAKNVFSFSSGVLLISFFTVALVVLIERFLFFRIESRLSATMPPANRILILGVGATAVRLRHALESAPQLRSRVVGFLKTNSSEPASEMSADLIKGDLADFDRFMESEEQVNEVILADPSLSHEKVLELVLACERNMVNFKIVADIFRILTSNVALQVVGDVPILGIGRWPLDIFWNRALKRIEDIGGSLVGLIIASPIILLAAILVKHSSPGPVLYRQERCGEKGKTFTLYKLRTMADNAERQSGPVWAAEGDPRRTPVGSFLRRHNLDELPQLWNVLKGDMSLVGPRPERPHFVEQFKETIGRYMSRHLFKPGLTGWAQVNGLRGNTSIEARINYDLYYLENWSLALDFKILLKTLSAKENAY